jgi:hypothetical protein
MGQANHHHLPSPIPFMTRPSTPQEYDNFNNYNPQIFNYVVPEEEQVQQESTDDGSNSVEEPKEQQQQQPTVLPVEKFQEEHPKLQIVPKFRRMKIRKQHQPGPEPTQLSPTILTSTLGTRNNVSQTSAETTTTTTTTTTTSAPQTIPTTNTLTANYKLEEVLANLERIGGLQEELMKPESTQNSPVVSTTFSTSAQGKSLSSHPYDNNNRNSGANNNNKGEGVDLSPDGPVMGLITSYATYDRDSPACQKKALCELAMRGKNPGASRFEGFLWNLASL